MNPLPILASPTAGHPQIELIAVNYDSATIRFNWLNAAGLPADTGNSLMPFTSTGATLSDAEIVAAISA